MACGRSRSMMAASVRHSSGSTYVRDGELRVGHDRRRVRVDEDDVEPLFAQRLRALRAGVVELAGLPDDDGARADEEDALEVGAAGHGLVLRRGLALGAD